MVSCKLFPVSVALQQTQEEDMFIIVLRLRRRILTAVVVLLPAVITILLYFCIKNPLVNLNNVETSRHYYHQVIFFKRKIQICNLRLCEKD